MVPVFFQLIFLNGIASNTCKLSKIRKANHVPIKRETGASNLWFDHHTICAEHTLAPFRQRTGKNNQLRILTDQPDYRPVFKQPTPPRDPGKARPPRHPGTSLPPPGVPVDAL